MTAYREELLKILREMRAKALEISSELETQIEAGTPMTELAADTSSIERGVKEAYLLIALIASEEEGV